MEEQFAPQTANGAETVAEKAPDRASSAIGEAQHLAAEYIDASEKYAMKLIELQDRAGSWMKKTPLKPLVEARNALSRRVVSISARAARAAFRLQAPG